jgi:hypothetical protein
MIEYHEKIMALLYKEWIIKKKNDYYIYLVKDNVQLKISKTNGVIVKEEKILKP